MINCPIDIEVVCQDCRYNTDSKCWWYFPARPLKEILTLEERLEMKPLPQPQWVGSQWDALNQLKSEVQGWRQKHATMMTELDKLNKKPKSKFD